MKGESVISGELCNVYKAADITGLEPLTVWRNREHLRCEKVDGNLWYRTFDCHHFSQVSGELVLTRQEVADNQCCDPSTVSRWYAKDYVPELRQKGECKGFKAVEWIRTQSGWPLLKIEKI